MADDAGPSDAEAREEFMKWGRKIGETDGCNYVNLNIDETLTRSFGINRLGIGLLDEAKAKWFGYQFAHMYVADQTLLNIVCEAFGELDFSERRVIPLQKDDPSVSAIDTILHSCSTSFHFAISYVHRTAESKRGLMKVSEVVELHIIDSLIKLAQQKGKARVFVWSDRTLSSNVQKFPRSNWPLVGLYGCSFIPTVVLLDDDTVHRLWPCVELTLSELGPGFLVAHHEDSYCSLDTCQRIASGSVFAKDAGPFELDVKGRGLSTREALFGLARQFLQTGISALDTFYQEDRLLLRSLFVSLLRGRAWSSFGHHVFCGPQCLHRKEGSMLVFLGNLSAKIISEARSDTDVSSMLWAGEFNHVSRGMVFRGEEGFFRALKEAIRGSAHRVGMQDDWEEQLLGLRTGASTLLVTYSSGMTATVKVHGVPNRSNSTLRYWCEWGCLITVSLCKTSATGYHRWPGASAVFGNASTREMFCLLMGWMRAPEGIKQRLESEMAYLASQEITLMGMVPKLGFVVSSEVNVIHPEVFFPACEKVGKEDGQRASTDGTLTVAEDHMYVTLGGEKVVIGVGKLVCARIVEALEPEQMDVLVSNLRSSRNIGYTVCGSGQWTVNLPRGRERCDPNARYFASGNGCWSIDFENQTEGGNFQVMKWNDLDPFEYIGMHF